MKSKLHARVVAEFLGTGFFVAAVVGSGIMAESLAGGNVALALLANTIATGASLVALILTFGPISGAHFNPVVSVAEAMEGALFWREVPSYVLAQVLGGIGGAMLANAMFGLSLISFSQHVRRGPAQLLSEFVVTFGLLSVICGCSRSRSGTTPFAVGGYITAGYWFTASTCLANPVVTIARSFGSTLSSIRPADVPLFLVAQFAGGIAATLLFRWLIPDIPSTAKNVGLPHDTAAQVPTNAAGQTDSWYGRCPVIRPTRRFKLSSSQSVARGAVVNPLLGIQNLSPVRWLDRSVIRWMKLRKLSPPLLRKGCRCLQDMPRHAFGARRHGQRCRKRVIAMVQAAGRSR
jgi:glycerol uptake facilitator-like aquaporin